MLLSGCVAQDDFGRRAPSGVNQRLGLNGYAHLPGYENASNLAVPLSEDEAELRGRAYSLVFTYAHEPTRDHWTTPDRYITNPLPIEHFPKADAYARKIASAGYQSPEARINAIVDDIRADLAQIEAFQRVAQDVYANDAARLVDLERYATSERTGNGVAGRVADNRYLIEKTLVALVEKIAGYELALGDGIVAAGRNSRIAAQMELEGIKRRAARLEADLRHVDGRYALTMPREPLCAESSLGRPC